MRPGLTAPAAGQVMRSPQFWLEHEPKSHTLNLTELLVRGHAIVHVAIIDWHQL